MHDRPGEIPTRQNRRSARPVTPPPSGAPTASRTLGELLDALAANLVDLRIRAGGVEVEVEIGARRLRVHRAIPEGDHDVAARAVEALEDAAAAIDAFRGRP